MGPTYGQPLDTFYSDNLIGNIASDISCLTGHINSPIKYFAVSETALNVKYVDNFYYFEIYRTD